MILPTTYAAALFLMVLSMLCWGSWANTFKLTGKWRFELFYYDYAFGVLLAAVVAAFTFGSLGSELTFYDNFLIAGNRKVLYGFGAGVVFNLANMLLVAAISVAGLAVAFPIGIGLALVIGVLWNYHLNPQGNSTFLFGGAALVVIAIVLDAAAYHALDKYRVAQRIAAASVVKTGKKIQKYTGSGLKGIILSVIAGVLMGTFYPLVEIGKEGEAGLGAYSIALVFALGVFLSTFVFNLYFINLPVQGQPIAMSEYFLGNRRQHLLGILGGAIWCVGAIANFAAASAPMTLQIGPAISYALGQGATMVSALWGVLVWKEFADANFQIKLLLVLMFLFFMAGLGLISMAPLYPR